MFLNCFWISLKYLQKYLKGIQCEATGAEELRMLSDFKEAVFISEVKKIGEKSAKNCIKLLKTFFNSRESLESFGKKQRVEFEESELKNKLNKEVLLPVRMELDNMIPKKMEPKLLNILSREVMFFLTDFIFQNIYNKYMFTEFGLEFFEVCMHKLVALIQEKFKMSYCGLLEK